MAGEARRRGRGQVAIREVEAGGSSRESGRELQLARTPWVLLGPQLSEHVWDPAVDRSELVQARMTPPAEGDQGGGEIRGPTAANSDDAARAQQPTSPGSSGSQLHGAEAGRALGCGYNLHPDLGGVLVSGRGGRCVQPPCRGLGDGHSPENRVGDQRPEHGDLAATSERCDSSLGPGISQYTSIEFGQRFRKAEVSLSMGSVGDCYDNALCESFFATLECELLERSSFRTPGWPSSTSWEVGTTPTVVIRLWSMNPQ